MHIKKRITRSEIFQKRKIDIQKKKELNKNNTEEKRE